MILFVTIMKKLLAAVSSGLLLAFSWPSIGVFPLIFFAFLPLLIFEERAEKGKSVFGYGYLAFLIFNLITTYWVWHATPGGSVVAFLLNSLLMAFAFYVFHKIKKATKPRLGYLAFIVCWLSFEYLHLNWDLSWPWLTLGNVFANAPSIVQWYEYTGVLGGSLWVLLVNVLVFKAWTADSGKRKWIFPAFVVVFPVLISFYLGATKDLIMGKSTHEIVIVQPNVDPYTDKFNVGYEQQLADFIVLAKTKLTQNTALLIGPETALQEGIWENKLEVSYSVRAFRELQKQFPNLNILVGASTYKMFGHGEQKTATARQLRNKHVYYDAYNSAVFIPDSGQVQVYHKTKLVPGAEKTPFPKILDKLASLMLDLGGTSGSLGTKNKVHQFEVNEMSIQPLICYESIYGDLQKENTNLIAIITNDGWWKNTAGYKQHFEYARLRAVEQRRMIVRSANTGISGFISPYGEVIESTNWDEAICIATDVELNNEITFYSIFGDYLGRLSVFVAAMLFIVAFVKGRLKK
ncbi:MAG: Apolipoprotein N-acyltransferase [Cryomorphaceae bacterium]|nr:MAG: Apolipoprotein N-acyltransferase [Cryomorphaceae bacterium]